MEEKLISFETAKLLKEKGFGSISKKMYNKEGKLLPFKNYVAFDKYFAPTQSLVQKWLRENYNINVNVFSSSRFNWFVAIEQFNKDTKCFKETFYPMKEEVDLYEDALEIGLLDSLKLI